jgi:hypothetical protein
MSQTNDFRQANNPDRVYYDILQHNIGRNTETPARFIETTETPIINNTGDYKMSVVRFQIDTPNMPVLIIQPNPVKENSTGQVINYTRTAYEITLNYYHTDLEYLSNEVYTFSIWIDWKPQNPNVYKPTFDEYKDGKHINYEYFYCYSYSYFYDFIVNQSIKANYGFFIDGCYNFALSLGDDTNFLRQFSNWSYPPTFEWDENTQKTKIIVPPQFLTLDYLTFSYQSFPIKITEGNGNNFYASTMSVSPNFYTLISTFPYELDGLNYRLQFKTNFITNWVKQDPFLPNYDYTIYNESIPFPANPHAMTFGAFLVVGEQEWSSIDLMTPINSIVFISNTLPIIANQQSASKNKNNKDSYTPDSERNTTQHLLMITDLMTNQQGYRPNLLYVPSGQYRYITLTGNQPLNQIDINVFYQLKTGELIPFQLTNGGTASIKILFEKVVLGETKNLQFTNMSMRDLKL